MDQFKHTPAPINQLIPSDSEVLNEIKSRLNAKRLDTEEDIIRAVWYQNGFEEAVRWIRSSKKLKQYSAAPELLKALIECLEGVKELNGEYQDGWDDVIERAEQVIQRLAEQTN